MERKKEKKYRGLSVFSLIVSIIFLTIIFLIYSDTYIIEQNKNETGFLSDVNVYFTTTSSGDISSFILPEKSSDKIYASNAFYDNTANPVIKDLYARFTEPGQSVSYTFYAYNYGSDKGYLKSILYNNATSSSTSKNCIAHDPIDQPSTDIVCNGIYLNIKVGNDINTNKSIQNIYEHYLPKNTAEKIVVTISYDKNAGLPTGPFDVDFGDITLLYSSVD